MVEAPRVWLSTRTPARGEVVTVRTMVTHPMVTGLAAAEGGAPGERNIVHHVECSLNGATVFVWEPATAVAENPYLEFRFAARESGELRLVWLDDDGARFEAVETITVSG